MITKENIQIRDPFILPMENEDTYYLYGSTDKDIWKDKATGFDVYHSKDLEYWEGPFHAFRPPAGFWSDTNYWAPEVHEYKGKFFMFATFKAEGVCRGTQILVADNPLGPFVPHSDGPVTPREWECLDGTFFIDNNDNPWMIFCHEWVQISDGTVCAIQLSQDLDKAIGEPIQLFSASEAKWPESKTHRIYGDGFVTDGPFLHRCRNGALVMIWSSFSNDQYAQGVAVSESGDVLGPWKQQSEPLYESDGGHGMIFTTFEGQVMLTLHSPNQSPNERVVFIELQEEGDSIQLK